MIGLVQKRPRAGSVRERIFTLPALVAGERLTSRQIAEAIGVGTKQVTTQISAMARRGALLKTSVAGKAALYSLPDADPLRQITPADLITGRAWPAPRLVAGLDTA